VEGGDAASRGAGGGSWKPLEIRLLSAFLVQRSLAATIQGHGDGRAVLDDDDMIASLFILCREDLLQSYSGIEVPRPAKWFSPRLGLGWRRRGSASRRRVLWT
jgi:hypothetical protein